MILKWITKIWNFINKLSPETRTLVIIFLFGYVLYIQIADSTKAIIKERFLEEILCNKKAENYSMKTSIDINRLIQLIAEKDEDAYDVLLLNYHNNTQSLQGYKYLYLSCLTEAPKSLDTPLLRQQWNRIDYIYYADELARIHSQSFVYLGDINLLSKYFPKLYRLVKSSDAEAVAFYTIEGHDNAIGMVVVLYKEPISLGYKAYRDIIPCILRLAILLDYDNLK